MIKTLKILLVIFVAVFLLNGCIVVKNEDESKEYVPVLHLSPQPDIPMSDVMIRSTQGDMLAFLPKDWFLVNVEESAPTDVIAVSVNPEYSMSAIFSQIRKTPQMDTTVAKEGLLALARLALDKRAKKTAGSVKHIGKYSTINMGPRIFAMYEFTNSDSSMTGTSAVFKSTLNEYYEMTVIPINLKGIVVPAKSDIDKVFNSILTTIHY